LSARGTWRAHFLGRRRVYSKQRGSSLHDKKKTNNNNTPPSRDPSIESSRTLCHPLLGPPFPTPIAPSSLHTWTGSLRGKALHLPTLVTC
jgi:hypothetical protein